MTSSDFNQDLKNFLLTHPYQKITIQGSCFRYIISGKEGNSSIVFLNGLNMQESWIKYMEYFEKDYRVLMMEYPLEPKTNNELLDLISGLLKALNITKPIIIGASDGGVLAQLYLRRFPQNIGGLILMTTVTLDSKYVEDMRNEPNPKIFQFLFRLLPYSILKKKLVGQASSYINGESETEQEYGRSFLQTIASDSYYKKKFIHIFGLVNEMSKHKNFNREEFNPIKGKVLILNPEKDLFSKEDQERLAKLIPEADIKYMRGGHLAFIMCAEEYIEVINHFLTKI